MSTGQISTHAHGAASDSGQDVLDAVLDESPPPFALLYRPHVNRDVVEVFTGAVSTPTTLSDVDVPDGAGWRTLVVVPFRQITERGFAAVDDGEPLIALTVTDSARLLLQDVLNRIPDVPITVTNGRFDVTDDDYADLVDRIKEQEIGRGEGANFVVHRSFTARIDDYSPATALTLFRRLMAQEAGTYWIFLVHLGDRTFIGATPERHVSLDAGTAVMNPISGTYRYPPEGPSLTGVLDFLADVKESDELYMVVDEELKMMARVCADGVRVRGPHLKQMARLAHTEYFIDGHSDLDPRVVLKETLFAPTVTGSPLESACRVIARHEPHGRGYYSGVVALLGHDEHGAHAMDSAILIRTADVDRCGALRLGVGATVVRHSSARDEVAETTAKAAGMLAALYPPDTTALSEHPRVRLALSERNDLVSQFWMADTTGTPEQPAGLDGLTALVVDAEDTFTAMLAHLLRSLGLSVDVRRFDEHHDLSGYDVVVLGPGPGDPRDRDDHKISRLGHAVERLLRDGQPFLAICLSHQVLCRILDLPLVRRATPNQGTRKRISLFGELEHVGFYNTFAAHSAHDTIEYPEIGKVQICRDTDTTAAAAEAEVHALKGPHFASVQFHPESILTHDGRRIIATLLSAALRR